MKKFLIFCLIVLICLHIRGQSHNDQSQLLQECLSISEIEQYFHSDDALYIMQHKVAFDDQMTVNVFGKQLIFLNKDNLYSRSPETFLRFDVFEINDHSARVVYDLHSKRGTQNNYQLIYRISIDLKKKNNNTWNIETINKESR